MLKSVRNIGTDKGFTLTEFRAPGHVTANLEVENWQKVDTSVSTDINEKIFRGF